MTRKMLMLGAVAMTLGPPLAAAAVPPAAPGARPTANAHTATAAPATTTNQGQPNASCETTPNPPGNSASAPGSAFNPDGTAGQHYAGEQPQNSKNPNAVSQYDVACARPH